MSVKPDPALAAHPYESLTPDVVLDALATLGPVSYTHLTLPTN